MKATRFRAWNGEQMIYKVVTGEGIWGLYDDLCSIVDFDKIQEKIKIMQFTGLLDKNGVQIWSDDICKCIQREQGGQNPFQRIERVYAKAGGFTLFNKPMQEYYTLKDYSTIKNYMWQDRGNFAHEPTYYEIVEIEVIGNIYENPELLGL
jgi:uncharacterized phage protein (TIGR01671 family)